MYGIIERKRNNKCESDRGSVTNIEATTNICALQTETRKHETS